jgi:hypothetical protein
MTAAPDIRHYPARDGVWEVLRSPAEQAREHELWRLRQIAIREEVKRRTLYLREGEHAAR